MYHILSLILKYDTVIDKCRKSINLPPNEIILHNALNTIDFMIFWIFKTKTSAERNGILVFK